MAKLLAVDFDQMQRTLSLYDEAVSQLQNAITSLDTAMDYLKNSGWKSGASTAYFKTFESSWRKSLETCITEISFQRENLVFAQNNYEALKEEADHLADAIGECY